MPRVKVASTASSCEALECGVCRVHRDALDELRARGTRRRLEPGQLGRSEEHMWQDDVVPVGQVGLDQGKRCWPDELASGLEVSVPSADEGPECVDVTVEDPGCSATWRRARVDFPMPGGPLR